MAVSPANRSGSDPLVVLVVEDEFLLRCDVAEQLQDCGCTVLEADSGERAIAMCKSQMPVDVVLTDINLNGGPSGWDVAEAARAARPGVGVVYASGNGVDHSRCVSGSVFFSKPYRVSDILAACRRLSRAPRRRI